MELERLVAALIRKWWIVAALGFIGALFGIAAEGSRVDTFTATASIEIAPDRNVYGSETVLNRLVINEIGAIGSVQLRESVVDGLGEAGTGIDPMGDLAVQQVPDTELVNVSVSATNEASAIAAANSWAQAYVELVRERERGDLEERVQAVNNELQQARSERLSLDAELRETVIVRRSGTVSTYNETVLREPLLWDGIVKVDQEIGLLVAERAAAQLALANVLDSKIASTAVGPIDPVRSGNGLGPLQGLIIGLAAAVTVVAAVTHGRISLRAAGEITNSVWPTSLRLARHRFMLPWRKRKIVRNVNAVGTQILIRLPDTRLQVVSFAGIDPERTQVLKAALAEDLQRRGYSVSLMGDHRESIQSRTVEGMLDLLHAEESVIFADLGELQSKNFSGRIVTVVSVDEHRDPEKLAAKQIADSLEISDTVLTVVSR